MFIPINDDSSINIIFIFPNRSFRFEISDADKSYFIQNNLWMCIPLSKLDALAVYAVLAFVSGYNAPN